MAKASASVTLPPFFILGSGRCGSTLLRRILTASPEVHIPPESYAIPDAIRFFNLRRLSTCQELLMYILAKIEYAPERLSQKATIQSLAQTFFQSPEKLPPLSRVFGRLKRSGLVSKSELNRLSGEVSAFLVDENQNITWKDHVRLVLGAFEFIGEFKHYGFRFAPYFAEVIAWPAERRRFSELIDFLYRKHAETLGKSNLSCWGDKTPTNSTAVIQIARAFPTARIIHLVRDGVDVSYSFWNRGLARTLEEAATIWKTRTKIVHRFAIKNPHRSIEIRYEDLVRAPGPTVSKICRFIGIDYRPEMLTELHHVDLLGDVNAHPHHTKARGLIQSGSIGVGRRLIKPTEQKRLERSLHGLQRELGYTNEA